MNWDRRAFGADERIRTSTGLSPHQALDLARLPFRHIRMFNSVNYQSVHGQRSVRISSPKRRGAFQARLATSRVRYPSFNGGRNTRNPTLSRRIAFEASLPPWKFALQRSFDSHGARRIRAELTCASASLSRRAAKPVRARAPYWRRAEGMIPKPFRVRIAFKTSAARLSASPSRQKINP